MGGLIIASKLSIPIIPKLEIVIVPPFNSSAFNLLFFDLSINDFVSILIQTFLFFMSLITGVIRPSSIAIANATSVDLDLIILSSPQVTLQSGLLSRA